VLDAVIVLLFAVAAALIGYRLAERNRRIAANRAWLCAAGLAAVGVGVGALAAAGITV
jgi:hypothetical protein